MSDNPPDGSRSDDGFPARRLRDVASLRPGPAAPGMSYAVEHGRIVTWALEAHVVDHCNLRCEHCCTVSPALEPRQVDPGALFADAARAATALRPQLFKLTGGEPLLHADLLGCIEAVRRSGIAEQVSITTNGWRLPETSDAVLEAIDRLTLSVYASAPLSESRIAEAAERCRRAGTLLTVKRIDRFGRMDRAVPASRDETARVFAECWLRHRCHLIHEGRFFVCTRPPHLEATRRPGGGAADLATLDGVALHAEGLLERLLERLGSQTPLESCRVCLGASGGWQPHRQLAPLRRERGEPTRRGGERSGGSL